MTVHRSDDGRNPTTFNNSELFLLLSHSVDPRTVSKYENDCAGLSLYSRAGEAQVWGSDMYAHLQAWNNGRAALSDREYVAELYRCAFSSPDPMAAAVAAGYPAAAQDWVKRVASL